MSKKAELGCWEKRSSEEKYYEPLSESERGKGAQKQSYHRTFTDASLGAQTGTNAVVAES